MSDDTESHIASALTSLDCLYAACLYRKTEQKDYVNVRKTINLLADKIKELQADNELNLSVIEEITTANSLKESE